MIIRIVRMTFIPGRTDSFLKIFNQSRTQILETPGCTHLEVWRDVHDRHIFVTHSHWESEAALNVYRSSEFFREVWKETKVLFAEKPLAFSVEKCQ